MHVDMCHIVGPGWCSRFGSMVGWYRRFNKFKSKGILRFVLLCLYYIGTVKRYDNELLWPLCSVCWPSVLKNNTTVTESNDGHRNDGSAGCMITITSGMMKCLQGLEPTPRSQSQNTSNRTIYFLVWVYGFNMQEGSHRIRRWA